MHRPRFRVALVAPLGLAVAAVAAPPPVPTVSFDRDVRAILSENCYKCHGPDPHTRLAGLRLDTFAGATARLADGRRAIVPGDPVASALIERIALPHGDARQMPPAATNRTVRPEQLLTLRRWIAQGARYEEHWSFVKPVRPAVPGGYGSAIDAFVRTRLAREGLKPAPEADKRTLIRRASLDLTGLPPTPEETDTFLADTAPGAYERVVDRLLANPHYGERMAIGWLDLARYADTHGYHIDSHRDMYRWRDWVIDAFNRNLPYDTFVTEQLAGDLLPNATLSQRIATGFNRNHPINFEGGAIPEEYQTAYVADRVDTTSTAFLGLTVRCAQCHDHKYDPISQRDYYRFFAFFNNISEEGLDGQSGNAKPFVRAPYPEQETRLAWLNEENRRLDASIAAREATGSDAAAAFGPQAVAAWDAALAPGLVRTLTFAGVDGRTPVGKPTFGPGYVDGAVTLDGTSALDHAPTTGLTRTTAFSYGAWVKLTTAAGNQTVLSQMDAPNGVRGFDLFVADGGRPMAHFIHNWPGDALRVDSRETIPAGKWTHLLVVYDGTGKSMGVRLYIDGRKVATDVGMDTLRSEFSVEKPLRVGGRWPGADFKGMVDTVRLWKRALTDEDARRIAETDPLRPIVALPAEKRSPEQQKTLVRLALQANDPAYRAALDARAKVAAGREALEREIPTTMVMDERTPPRPTHILERGQYDRPRETVTPGLPTAFARADGKSRLDLARWLTSPDNPLTARVAVNRLWQQFFGAGLVRTSENFGVQGEFPSHPELLDWLATEFVRTGWDVKGLIRQMVLSQTYRQSSRADAATLRRDPENRLLARAGRLRLPAELLRDQALATSGLLVEKIGGPSVKPYHPAGLWEELSFKGGFSAQFYEQDHGEKLYRRSLYTFWKRTVPPPSLQTFDAPEREFCIVRRPATNTPLQALVMLNDPTYLEASRKLAERTIREAGPSVDRRIDRIFARVLARPAAPSERATLLRLANEEYSGFLRAPQRARALLMVGESPADPKLDPAEVAAWTTVASTVLNLDEAILRP